MRRARRRRPRSRLLLIVAALASIIVGYYAGQYWQRRPLEGLSVQVFDQGRPITYPEQFGIGFDNRHWRLFLAVDTRQPACRELLRHFALVVNRLAAWPKVQARLRLTLLAYDQPGSNAIAAFTGGVNWVDVVTADAGSLDAVTQQLDIQPHGTIWCSEGTAGGVLVAPKHRAWARIPMEPAAVMARNIAGVVGFVE